MRSILIHVDSDHAFEARVQTSLDLARAFQAHVTFLQAIPYELGVPGDAYGAMITEAAVAFQEAADRVRSELEARLAREDLAWDWCQLDGWSKVIVNRRSALSDLVVLGPHQPFDAKGAPSPLVSDVALHSRTPLLLVPEETRAFEFDRPAIVAWNGSLESAHALRAAVPLLREMAGVVLVEVTDPEPKEQPALPSLEGAEYLARHDVRCEIVAISQEGSVAETLSDAASVRKAGLLVMGAYGHSRSLEWAFGGVTRQLLARPPLPIFAAH
ncbi:universal stress protein A [Tsuneonella deserti]|uniref:Universal stress protein A n=1 Tax=Tsuneonella deserti TaxID=2035528 RepID=A0ABQ1SCC9_9SPHN|nr:universal stress protein [Tsuneonella deserti]GGE01621.1 universal stress protein A [Tsuneonella deserti]